MNKMSSHPTNAFQCPKCKRYFPAEYEFHEYCNDCKEKVQGETEKQKYEEIKQKAWEAVMVFFSHPPKVDNKSVLKRDEIVNNAWSLAEYFCEYAKEKENKDA